MYPSSGGLFGKSRTTSVDQSVPGIWTMEEQIQAARQNLWTGTGPSLPSWSTSSVGSINNINLNSVSVAVTLENLKTVLNNASFQNKSADRTYEFKFPGSSGSSWSFTWNNFDIVTYPSIYLRLQRVSTFNVNWTVSGTGLTETSGTVSFRTTQFEIPLTASSGSGTLTANNSNNGLVIQDMVLGNPSSLLYVPWA
jgi:hypothetical protein